MNTLFSKAISLVISLWIAKVFLFSLPYKFTNHPDTSGAAFFHLFTPLGIKVIHEGKSDNGSLFFAAVSIIVLGLVLAFINKSALKSD